MASGGKEYQLAIKIAGRLDSSFNTAVSGALKSLTGLGGKALVGATKLTAKALAGTAAAVAAVGAVSVKTGKEFDTAMSQVAATMYTAAP